jgi:hypothetical protein
MPANAVIERERRWAIPAAALGFLSAALLIAGVLVRLQVPQKSNASDQLLQFSQHGNALDASAVLMGLGFVVAAAPLAYLFLAAAARSQRVRQGFLAVVIIGGLLFGARLAMASFALSQSGDDFAAQQNSEPTHDIAYLKQAIAKQADTLNTVTLYNTDGKTNVAEVEQDNSSSDSPGGGCDQSSCFYIVSFPASAEAGLKASLDKAGIDESEDSSGKRGDAFANHLALNSSGFKAAGALALPAGLAMIFAIVYPALQAFRVGLISRLFSTLGAIVGASLIILPIAPALIGVWLIWLCLLFLGRQPGAHPPAWEAGVAIPWPRPGQPPPDSPIEGSAREVDPNAPAANPPRQRGERRKRKSRS